MWMGQANNEGAKGKERAPSWCDGAAPRHQDTIAAAAGQLASAAGDRQQRPSERRTHLVRHTRVGNRVADSLRAGATARPARVWVGTAVIRKNSVKREEPAKNGRISGSSFWSVQNTHRSLLQYMHSWQYIHVTPPMSKLLQLLESKSCGSGRRRRAAASGAGHEWS